MDPDAALRELRGIAREVLAHDGSEDAQADLCRLAELIEAIDGWITGGGFLPARWRRGTR